MYYLYSIFIYLLFMSIVLTDTPGNYETGKNVMRQKKKTKKSKINSESFSSLLRRTNL